MTRGIYLVANRRVERESAHLVRSLREAGCTLPIALIPFDDNLPVHPFLRKETTIMPLESFPAEARAIVADLGRLWPGTRAGLFRRFLTFCGPYDEFIYSDNDIVALTDWTRLFDYLGSYDLIHADYEYRTGGCYNYRQPEVIQKEFGADVLESALTSGHFAARRNPAMMKALAEAGAWAKNHPGVLYEHDQPVMHLATLLARLRVHNFCRPPDDWPSTWAGDYRNALEVIQTAQSRGHMFHLHYSGSQPDGYYASQELYFSELSDHERMRMHVALAIRHWSGYHYLTGRFWRGLQRRYRRLFGS